MENAEAGQLLVASGAAEAAIVTAGAANPSSAYSEFNKQQRGKALRWFSSGPRDHLVLMVIALTVGVSALRVPENLASDNFQFACWSACAATVKP